MARLDLTLTAHRHSERVLMQLNNKLSKSAFQAQI